MVKIAAWNLGLGLKNKKEYVKKIIEEHKMDIWGFQECGVPIDFPKGILSFRNYNIELYHIIKMWNVRK